MKIRLYCEKEDSIGHDEGGFYKIIEVPEISAKLKKRMKSCSGCYCEFYNGRSNITGNTCWSLDNDNNFKGRGKPKCHH